MHVIFVEYVNCKWYAHLPFLNESVSSDNNNDEPILQTKNIILR